MSSDLMDSEVNEDFTLKGRALHQHDQIAMPAISLIKIKACLIFNLTLSCSIVEQKQWKKNESGCRTHTHGSIEGYTCDCLILHFSNIPDAKQ